MTRDYPCYLILNHPLLMLLSRAAEGHDIDYTATYSENINATGSNIIHRTQAINAKRPYRTIEEEQEVRQDILGEQIKILMRVLPTLLQKLSRIPDPRRPKSVKHKISVLMIFGLLAFVFRLKSCREMNIELTGAAINHHLQKIFPELDSIPHADTLARFLETANLKEIEFAHITMIKHTSWERNWL